MSKAAAYNGSGDAKYEKNHRICEVCDAYESISHCATQYRNDRADQSPQNSRADLLAGVAEII
jgi:hypothetical protein